MGINGTNIAAPVGMGMPRSTASAPTQRRSNITQGKNITTLAMIAALELRYNTCSNAPPTTMLTPNTTTYLSEAFIKR
jgi:hypothetical protein